MFRKVLIANRGEIACRIIRTLKRLGIGSVAVYSDADADALHVALADEAFHIGPAPATQSYLVIDRIMAAVRRSGAEAVHPGYGFLAENAGFAEACAAAGVVFIGPPVAAIAAMGSKQEAKRIMERAGVPLVPGYHGESQAEDELLRQVEQIGFPLLIKASAGGGGKGMRVVHAAADFPAALAGARREASSAFGDDRVLLERYLLQPRHIEIQVFADGFGDVVHLFERDCSIQRRHQKVIEEAPACRIDTGLRTRMGDAAVAAARAIGYVGAGTVEFLLDAAGEFYFMEMNTRLQVEHPVTEMVTGQDLVEWQLRVAAGEPLPADQDRLQLNGHAIEVRIYAEDPARDFLPMTGRLHHLRTPAENPHVRIDTGVRQGDQVSIHYDPMLAKLIVWDRDRAGALRRLQGALVDCQVVGVATNLNLLAAIAAHEAFTAGGVDTGFIDRFGDELLPAANPASDQLTALAVLYLLLERERTAHLAAERSVDPGSPWHLTDGWRLNSTHRQTLPLLVGHEPLAVTVNYRQPGYELEFSGKRMAVSGELEGDGELFAMLDGVRTRGTIVQRGGELIVLHGHCSQVCRLVDPLHRSGGDEGGEGRLTAPMPGKVIALLAEPGAEVVRGTPLLILEAMKMEHTIKAPCDGEVESFYFQVDDLVDEGAELLAFAEKGDA